MPVSFRSETHAQGLVHNKPSGVVDGDFLLASFALWSDSATVDTLSGWTLVPNCSNLSAGSGPDCRLQSFYKIASSEPSSWTWTVTGVSSGTVGTVTAYEGVDSATAIEVSNGQGNGQSSAVIAPSVDPSISVGFLIFVGGFPGDAAAPAWTPPGGMTERVDYGLTNVAAVTVCTEQLASSDPTGTRTATYSGSKRNCGQSIILRQIGLPIEVTVNTIPIILNIEPPTVEYLGPLEEIHGVVPLTIQLVPPVAPIELLMPVMHIELYQLGTVSEYIPPGSGGNSRSLLGVGQ